MILRNAVISFVTLVAVALTCAAQQVRKKADPEDFFAAIRDAPLVREVTPDGWYTIINCKMGGGDFFPQYTFVKIEDDEVILKKKVYRLPSDKQPVDEKETLLTIPVNRIVEIYSIEGPGK